MQQKELYMLDTNTASYIIKGRPASVTGHLQEKPMASICISSITQAELLWGVARKPEAKHLPVIVNEFLLRVNCMPWNSQVAGVYAQFRTDCEKKGTPLGTMDMLIAAHSIAAGAVLVTNDKAFYNIGFPIELEDWTAS